MPTTVDEILKAKQGLRHRAKAVADAEQARLDAEREIDAESLEAYARQFCIDELGEAPEDAYALKMHHGLRDKATNSAEILFGIEGISFRVRRGIDAEKDDYGQIYVQFNTTNGGWVTYTCLLDIGRKL